MSGGARVLMINLHSSRNAGDAALMLSAIAQLRHNLEGCTLTLAMNDPDGYAGDSQVIQSALTLVKDIRPGQRSPWRLSGWPRLAALALGCLFYRWTGRRVRGLRPAAAQALLDAYCQADLVVSCPGGFLYSSGRAGLALVVAVYAMALAWLAGKPLYLFPQSIGPLEHRWQRRLVGWVLRRARLVMIREAVSLTPAALGVEATRLHQLPDMAWTFAGAPPAEARAWLAGQGVDLADGRPRLGMTAINWQAQRQGFRAQAQYEQALAAAARRFVEQVGGQVVFFAQVQGPTPDQDDRVPARRVIALAGLSPHDLCLAEGWSSAAQLKSAYGFMDVFVGSRLHSNIFALSQHVPAIAIAYQPKTVGVLRAVGLEGWVLPIETVDAPALAEKLMALWQARTEVRAALALRVPEMMQAAARAGQMVADDYARWSARR